MMRLRLSYWIAGLALLAALACSSSALPAVDGVVTDAAAEPTNTPIVTPKPTTVPTPLPLTVYEAAMRPGFERDIDPYLDGNHYWIDMAIEVEPVRIDGHQRVRYVNRSDDTLNEIVFRLVVNAFSYDQLQSISNVTVNGASVETSLSVGNTAATIQLPQSLASGDSVEIEMDFNVDLPESFDASYGRIADYGDIVTLASFYPMLSVYERGAWWDSPLLEQGDPAYSETALYDLNIITPSSYTMAASGTSLDSHRNVDSTTNTVIVTGPVRDLALVLMRNPELETSTQDGVTINIWSREGKHQDDEFGLNKTQLALRLFDDAFGEYPYNEFDVIEAPISAAGIEFPGLILMADAVWDRTDGSLFEFVLAHEIGHQWWYGLVSNDQINEPWLDEALADFSVIVYFREGYGEEAGQSVRDFFQEDVDDYIKNYDEDLPTGLPVSAYQGRQYSTFVYNKGALFYSHLEDDYGAGKVSQMLKAYFQRHRYGIVHNTDLRQITGELFGDDATQFFDEWVLGG